MNDITKGYKVKSIITFWLSFALNVIPMAVFLIIGFCNGTTTQKISIGFTAIAATVLGIIMLLNKVKLGRSLFWIVFLVLYFAFGQMYPIIISMGICTLLDELVVTPLHKRWSTDYNTNKQIDKRYGSAEGNTETES